MKLKKLRKIALIALALTAIGYQAYATCLECDLAANPGICMGGSCNYFNQYGSKCCGNTI